MSHPSPTSAAPGPSQPAPRRGKKRSKRSKPQSKRTPSPPPSNPYSPLGTPELQSTRAAWVEWLTSAPSLRGLWLVTEKVHGANFCLVVDADGSVRPAKRTAFLAESDRFFGYASLFASLVERARAAFAFVAAQCVEDGDELERVYLYGELAGGVYPHPTLLRSASDAAPSFVQSEIMYAPDHVFVAFDVALSTAQQPAKTYLSCGQALAAFHEAGILSVVPLFAGSLSDALAFDLDFATAVPRALGLPPLPGNLAEGVVVRSAEELLVPCGRGRECRAVFKRKSSAFAERVKAHAKLSFTSLVLELNFLFSTYLTRHRLTAAISKLGDDVTESVLLRALTDDVKADALGELPELEAKLAALSSHERGLVDKQLDEAALALMRAQSKMCVKCKPPPGKRFS